ncbi:hypothetical protein [Micromonospora inositola]|uniref:Uncharacterized protein n=1 Tax=Micromonospora inositola TaxID=47865 RepID=A0A1C5K3K3_9ACTN|nr:hypothetical protein [Micromonospora inositola]SCG77338.1 hypothetical protein GA0070613_6231 [Micromonospora inositola]
MSTTNIGVTTSPRTTAARGVAAAVVAVLGAAVTAIYGSYGGPSPSPSQEQAVPYVVGADIVVALLVFGLLLPWARRSDNRASGWGLGLSVLGLVAIPIAFWSGVVIVIAVAAILLGVHARRAAAQAARPAKLATTAVAVGAAALVLSTALLILGNTVLV